MPKNLKCRLKEFLTNDFDRSKFNMVAGGYLSLVCHPLYYFIYSFWLIQPYESAFFRLTSSVISIPLLFAHKYSQKYKPWMSLYWYFWVMFILPITFTYIMLMNDVSNLWIMGETMMVFLVILFVSNVFVMIFTLLFGCLFGYFIFKITSDVTLTINSREALQYLVLLPCVILCGVLFAFRGKQGEIEKKKAIMKSFTGSIVHEIRNPLNLINMIGMQLNKTLQKNNANLQSENFVISLQNLTSRISETVHDANNIISIILNDLSENKISKKDFSRNKISEFLPTILSKFGYKNEDEKNRVQLLLSYDFIFESLPERFSLIIYNLLKNSLYYSEKYPDLFVKIGTEKKTVKGIKYNVIYVEDNGAGIPAENISRIFDDFYTSNKKDGTGLGLSFCKRNMKSFGGDIICESQLGNEINGQRENGQRENGWTKFSLLFLQVS